MLGFTLASSKFPWRTSTSLASATRWGTVQYRSPALVGMTVSTNRSIRSRPTTWPLTLMTPFLSILIWPGGMVIGPLTPNTASPRWVESSLFWPIRNCPPRKCRGPRGVDTTRNPSPSSATSRSWPVYRRVPWLTSGRTVATCGNRSNPATGGPDTRARIVPNTASSFLKPVVWMLPRLWANNSICRSCVIAPARTGYNPRFMKQTSSQTWP